MNARPLSGDLGGAKMLGPPCGQIGRHIQKSPLSSREKIKEISDPLRLHLVLACWRRNEQDLIVLKPKAQPICIDTMFIEAW